MHLYRRAISYFRGDRLKIAASIALIAAGQFCSVVWPFPLAILIDVVLEHKQTSYLPYRIFREHAPSDAVRQVILLAVLMFAIRMIAQVLDMFRTLLSIRIGYNGLMRVRCDLYRK